jgi:hypothetical protein
MVGVFRTPALLDDVLGFIFVTQVEGDSPRASLAMLFIVT